MAYHSLSSCCSWQNREHSLHAYTPSTQGAATMTMSCPSAQGQQGYTHGGKGANLFDVLFITLWAGGSPRCSSGVPEGIIILQGVLSWPWDNSLQNRKACFTLMSHSKSRIGKITFVASEAYMFHPSQATKQATNPHFFQNLWQLSEMDD